MIQKIREKINIYMVKQPHKVVLMFILLLNILLFTASAFVISVLAPDDIQGGFWASVFYTISMILDAGCVQYVVADIGSASVTLIIVCLVTVLIGMVTFSGAVIGYITNYISSFIEKANEGQHALKISNHTVILNWNNRAAEIIHDLLFTEKKEVIVVLVSEGRDEVEQKIRDRLAETIKKNPALARKNTIIVREGDTYSTEQLHSISVSKAKTIILLNQDNAHRTEEASGKGNANTIKTLIQVAEMTSAEDSVDNQNIIVEVEDDWTRELCEKIIGHKEKLSKCHIIAVPVNQILGRILSQFSIMPELNLVYGSLFSNEGAEFFCRECEPIPDETKYISEFLSTHSAALPIGGMNTKKGWNEFFVADSREDVDVMESVPAGTLNVKLNQNYWIEQKNVVILGHNSKSHQIIEGFNSFRNEWNRKDETGEKEILNVIVIDDKENLEKNHYYSSCPYVVRCIEADIYDGELICETINEFVDQNETDTTVLILSDDLVEEEDIDSNALTYLVYVHDIIAKRLSENPDFDVESIDVIVEILNPKNYDVVHSYSVNNIVISNRYVSKLLTQIGSKDALYELYCDMLTYDDSGADSYVSREMYMKKVYRFFDEIPGECTALELVRAVYEAGPEENKSIVLGVVSPGGRMILFTGDNLKRKIALTEKDKLIIYSNH